MRMDDLLYAILFFAFSMTALITVARLITRYMEFRRRPALDTTALEERMARIEQIVEATSIEVERISEGQRFVTRILAERPEPVTPPPTRSDAESALAEGRPILALGAGPIEPIRKAERQAVRQANTPH